MLAKLHIVTCYRRWFVSVLSREPYLHATLVVFAHFLTCLSDKGFCIDTTNITDWMNPHNRELKRQINRPTQWAQKLSAFSLMTERYKKLWKRLSQRIVEERCGVPDNLPWGDNERTGGIMIPPFVIQWLVLQNCALSSNFSCAKLFIFSSIL